MRKKKIRTNFLALSGVLAIIFGAAYSAVAGPVVADPSINGAFTRCSYKTAFKSRLLNSGSVVPV